MEQFLHETYEEWQFKDADFFYDFISGRRMWGWLHHAIKFTYLETIKPFLYMTGIGERRRLQNKYNQMAELRYEESFTIMNNILPMSMPCDRLINIIRWKIHCYLIVLFL